MANLSSSERILAGALNRTRGYGYAMAQSAVVCRRGYDGAGNMPGEDPRDMIE